ncbi:hypothetical protein, partial [Hungatella sp.]|uniref:hypothetical protein n=1 Tax=Hungatella sp. TaxID=2613924 RepID=UPI002A7EFDA1
CHYHRRAAFTEISSHTQIKLPRFLTNNPDATYSLGLRIVYILLGIGACLFSLSCIFSGW